MSMKQLKQSILCHLYQPNEYGILFIEMFQFTWSPGFQSLNLFFSSRTQALISEHKSWEPLASLDFVEIYIRIYNINAMLVWVCLLPAQRALLFQDFHMCSYNFGSWTWTLLTYISIG
jgi:hypothetical protein